MKKAIIYMFVLLSVLLMSAVNSTEDHVLCWEPLSSIEHYVIRLQEVDSNESLFYNTDKLCLTLTGLKPHTTYRWKVLSTTGHTGDWETFTTK